MCKSQFLFVLFAAFLELKKDFCWSPTDEKRKFSNVQGKKSGSRWIHWDALGSAFSPLRMLASKTRLISISCGIAFDGKMMTK